MLNLKKLRVRMGSSATRDFLTFAGVTDDVSRLDALHAVINRLPDPNYATIRALMFVSLGPAPRFRTLDAKTRQHLSRVQEKRSVNHMNIGNLAICFGYVCSFILVK